jgi:hypothetical protein
MAREIALPHGFVTIVDDEDFDWLCQWDWGVGRHRLGHAYAQRRGQYGLMHRLLMSAQAGQVVDHINGNTMDNRRANLRLCVHAENCRNRGPGSNNTSGFKGVRRSGAKWFAAITADRVCHPLGYFATRQEAAHAYDAAAKRLHGEFARLNFPEAA